MRTSTFNCRPCSSMDCVEKMNGHPSVVFTAEQLLEGVINEQNDADDHAYLEGSQTLLQKNKVVLNYTTHGRT